MSATTSTLLALPVVAQETEAKPGFFSEDGYLDAEQPDIIMRLRFGGQTSSAYFGSEDMVNSPDVAFRFDYIRFPNGFEYGSGQAVGFRRGWGLRGSARFIGARDPADYSELTGLKKVDWSQEFGLGIGYEEKAYRAFIDVRYGIIGHNSFVAELGADLISTPAEGWTMTLGPRLLLGSNRYMDTYFGVTADEAAASRYTEYNPYNGPVEAGLEFTARYDFNELWGLEAIVGWTRYMGDAADSPIVLGGSDENLKIEVGITRRISVDF